jgi:hypothetical protein
VSDEDDGHRLVFVGGAPRSGTTLLQKALNQHPSITGAGEFDFLPRIMTLFRSMEHSTKGGRLADYFTVDELRRAYARFVESLLLPLADERGTPLLSEKTPFNVLHFTDLAEVLPLARFVLVVRDPRDVVTSILDVGQKASASDRVAPAWTRDAVLAARQVRRCLIAGRVAQETLGPRLHTLRYEDLATDPEQALRDTIGFLGLEFDAQMLTHSSHVSRLSGVWYDEALYNRDVESSRVGRWTHDLDPAVAAMVERETGAAAAPFGYRFEPRPRSDRLRGRWSAARLGLRRRARQFRQVLGGD